MTTHLSWRKSSYSVANSACVEVAVVAAGPELGEARIAVRDSKNPNGPVLTYQADAWRWFVEDVRAGRVQRP